MKRELSNAELVDVIAFVLQWSHARDGSDEANEIALDTIQEMVETTLKVNYPEVYERVMQSVEN